MFVWALGLHPRVAFLDSGALDVVAMALPRSGLCYRPSDSSPVRLERHTEKSAPSYLRLWIGVRGCLGGECKRLSPQDFFLGSDLNGESAQGGR